MLEFEISTAFLYIRKEKSDWLINIWVPNEEKGGKRLLWMYNSNYYLKASTVEKPKVYNRYNPRRIGSLFASVKPGHFIRLHKAA